jgi:hypothetical protein
MPERAEPIRGLRVPAFEAHLHLSGHGFEVDGRCRQLIQRIYIRAVENLLFVVTLRGRGVP